MALNLLLATGTVQLKADPRQLNDALADARRKLLRFPTTIPVKFTADTKNLEQGILRAHGQIRTLRNVAGRPLRLTLNLQATQFAGQASALRQLKTLMGQPVTIRIMGDATDFAKKASRVWMVIQSMRRGVNVNMTANPWQLHAGLTQIEARLKKIQAMTNLRFRTGGLGGLGGFGGGGFGASMGIHSLMSSAGMGSLAGPMMTAMSGNPGIAAAEVAGMAVTSSMRLAADLQSQMATIRRVGNLSRQQTEGFKGKLFGIATNTPGSSIEDLIKMSTVGARAGVMEQHGTEGLLAFTQGMAKLKLLIPEMDIDKLGEEVLRTLNLFKRGPKDIEGFGSALGRLDQETSVSAADIFDITKRLSGAGQAANMTLPSIMALAAAMRNVGLPVESGSTAFSRVLFKMANDTEHLAQVAGLSAEKFAEAFNRDPIEALKMLMKQFEKVEEGTAKMRFLKEDLGLKNQRDVAMFGQLAKSIDSVPGLRKEASKEFESHETINKANDIANELANAEWGKLTEAVKQVADAFGTDLLPLLTPLVTSLRDLVRWANWTTGAGEFAKEGAPSERGVFSKLIDPSKEFRDAVFGDKSPIFQGSFKNPLATLFGAPPPLATGSKGNNVPELNAPGKVPVKDEAEKRAEAGAAAIKNLNDKKKQEREEQALREARHAQVVDGWKRAMRDMPKVELAVRDGLNLFKQGRDVVQQAKRTGLGILGAAVGQVVPPEGSARAKLAKEERIDRGKATLDEMPARHLQIHHGAESLTSSIQEAVLNRQEEMARLHVAALKESTKATQEAKTEIGTKLDELRKALGRLGAKE